MPTISFSQSEIFFLMVLEGDQPGFPIMTAEPTSALSAIAKKAFLHAPRFPEIVAPARDL